MSSDLRFFDVANLSLPNWTCLDMCRHAEGMTETGWQVIGRIAKARRERLKLNQDELGLYGGPKVATVGKFERAAQESFPLRTQHQMEKALGWSRGIVEQVVNSIDDGTLSAEDWEHDLIHEDVPDLSQPVGEVEDDGPALHALSYILRLIEPPAREAAVKDAIGAMLPYLNTVGTTRLGADLRVVHDFAEKILEEEAAYTGDPDDPPGEE